MPAEVLQITLSMLAMVQKSAVQERFVNLTTEALPVARPRERGHTERLTTLGS